MKWAVPALAWLLVQGTAVAAQAPTATAVFERYSDRVGRIEILDVGTDAKGSVGSAFFVSDGDLLITNYHVVASLVYEPEEHRARFTHETLDDSDVRLLAVDVVHDLALVAIEPRDVSGFEVGPITVRGGERLYALGYPADIGLSIVEGTYNGFVQHTLYPRVHFTGSLNPGMSGGPAIVDNGRLVGVNVSTAGNQLSFLVPAARVRDLLAKVAEPDYEPPEDWMAEVGAQLHAHQGRYVDAMLSDSLDVVQLGDHGVPVGRPSMFECWGGSFEDSDEHFTRRRHTCSAGDDIYLTRGSSSGVVRISHQLLETSKLNRFQFYNLYSNSYVGGAVSSGGSGTDNVTPYACREANVDLPAGTARVAYCSRRYKRFEGLFDLFLRSALLEHTDVGLLSTLSVFGVSEENARRLAHDFLDAIEWNP